MGFGHAKRDRKPTKREERRASERSHKRAVSMFGVGGYEVIGQGASSSTSHPAVIDPDVVGGSDRPADGEGVDWEGGSDYEGGEGGSDDSYVESERNAMGVTKHQPSEDGRYRHHLSLMFPEGLPRMISAEGASIPSATFAFPQMKTTDAGNQILDYKHGWVQPGFSQLKNGEDVWHCNCNAVGIAALRQAELSRGLNCFQQFEIESADCPHVRMVQKFVEQSGQCSLDIIDDSPKQGESSSLVGLLPLSCTPNPEGCSLLTFSDAEEEFDILDLSKPAVAVVISLGTFRGVGGAETVLHQVGLIDSITGKTPGLVVDGLCVSLTCTGSNRRCSHRTGYSKFHGDEDAGSPTPQTLNPKP